MYLLKQLDSCDVIVLLGTDIIYVIISADTLAQIYELFVTSKQQMLGKIN